jgi:hypothetical protein
LAAVLLAAPTVARGAGPDPQADALFQAAKASMARGDLPGACQQFAASLRIEPATGTLLNLAACEEKRGHLAVALQRFREARSRLPKDDYRVAFADEQIAALGVRTAELTLTLGKDAPAEARVFRDDVELAPADFGRPTPVDPGTHVVVVRAPGRADDRIEMSLREGDRRVAELHAGQELSVTPLEPPPGGASSRPAAAHDELPRVGVPRDAVSHDAPADGRRTLAYVAGAVGGVGLVVGIVTGWMTMNSANTYKDHCNAGACDKDGLDAASTGRTVQVVSPVAFAVGALGLGAGAYFFLTSSGSGRPAVAVQPMTSPSGFGASFAGAF